MNYRTIGIRDGSRTRGADLERIVPLPPGYANVVVVTTGVEPVLSALQAGALPTELHDQLSLPGFFSSGWSSPVLGQAFRRRSQQRRRRDALSCVEDGWSDGDRTRDLMSHNHALCLLSYAPHETWRPARAQPGVAPLSARTEDRWMRRVDLNHRSRAYEAGGDVRTPPLRNDGAH